MKKTALPLFLCLFILAGCVTTSVTPLSSETRDPISPEDVTIYLEEDDIPRDYAKMALINAKGSYNMTDKEQMFKKVREDAAELGANGVLLQGVEEPGTGEKVANYFLATGANREGEMIAIYVYEQGEVVGDDDGVIGEDDETEDDDDDNSQQ